LEALVEVDDPFVVGRGEAWIQDRFARSHAVTSVEATTFPRRWLLDPAGAVVVRLVETLSRMMATRRYGPARFKSAKPRRQLPR
jgi:hypothetical protein